jgi:hypothetical protein
MAAAHVTSRIEVLGIDNGTENDVVPVFEQLNEALGVMTSMAANEEAILALVKVGRSTWKALKINRVGWDGY